MAIPWRFFLSNSSNPNDRICELKRARSRTLTIDMLKPGSFSCAVPFDAPSALAATPWRTCIVAERMDRPLWSGPVSAVRGTFASKTVNITAVGWFDLLNRRILRARQTFDNWEAGAIAQSLVNYVNGIDDTGINVAYWEASQPRSITYEIGSYVGPAISALAELEDGFDFTIDPLTKDMTIWAKKQVIRDNTIFAIGEMPHNLSECEILEDGTTMCNYALAKGGNPWAEAKDDASINTFGEFDDFQNLSDVNNVDVLLAYVGVDVAIRATPRLTFSITPFPWTPDNSTPAFGDEYDLGDVVYITAVGGRYNFVKQAQRVYGVSFTIDDEGNERVSSLRTTPA